MAFGRAGGGIVAWNRKNWGMEMAQQTTVRLVDDITGQDADETISFGLDGKTYEIDLAAVNSQRLREALAPFVKAARVVKRRGQRRLGLVQSAPQAPSRAGRGKPQGEAAAKRAWLAANGFPSVANKRGRFTADQDLAWEHHLRREAAGKAPSVAEEAPADAPQEEAPVAPRKRGKGTEKPSVGEGLVEGIRASIAAAAPAKCTRITGLTSSQVGALKTFTDLVVESKATVVVLRGYPVDVIAEIERVRANTVFENVGEKRALAFVLNKLYEGKGVTTVDAA